MTRPDHTVGRRVRPMWAPARLRGRGPARPPRRRGGGNRRRRPMVWANPGHYLDRQSPVPEIPVARRCDRRSDRGRACGSSDGRPPSRSGGHESVLLSELARRQALGFPLSLAVVTLAAGLRPVTCARSHDLRDGAESRSSRSRSVLRHSLRPRGVRGAEASVDRVAVRVSRRRRLSCHRRCGPLRAPMMGFEALARGRRATAGAVARACGRPG